MTHGKGAGQAGGMGHTHPSTGCAGGGVQRRGKGGRGGEVSDRIRRIRRLKAAL